jgi:hypothetical protein
MRRLTDLFKKPRQKLRHHGDSRDTPPTDTLHQRTLEAAYGLPSRDAADELQHVQTYLLLTNARILRLQRLIGLEGANVARTAELKRKLKETHRDLEEFQQEVEKEHGEAAARPLEDVERGVWQALEELDRFERIEEDDYLMSGALRVEDEASSRLSEVSPEPLEMVKRPPKLMARGKQSRFSIETDGEADTTHLDIELDPDGEETNPERWPQPRDEVIVRLQNEEANTSLHIRDAHKARRGSCNGFMVTDMVMSGVEDESFVLPYLHHIKHHEVRALKKWLTCNKLVHRSGTLSRMEKVLHAMQLLQTGSRYESIAVLFSRAPRQVRESCHEVLAGMLDLYDATVDESVVAEVYAPLWGITKRCALGEDAERAERYFGFRWTEVAKVLIALNLYIGRWRGSKSPFEGQPFPWGRFLGVEEAGMVVEEEQEQDSSEASQRGASTSSSSPYEEPIIQAIPRPV